MVHSPFPPYAEPSEAEQSLKAAVKGLHRSAGRAVAFAGRIEHQTLRLTQFVGVRTSLLRDLAVRPDTGAGGRAWTRGAVMVVDDYPRSRAITHDYDRPVTVEGLRSMVAAPVVVAGRTRAVLYLAARDDTSLGDRAASRVQDAARDLAREYEVQDEVSRRVQLLTDARAGAGADPGLIDRVRTAHAELRTLARTVEDESLRARLDEIRAGLAPSRPAPARLSAREVDVLALVALGCSYTEVAGRLQLSPQSVKTYMRNVLAKLHVHSRHQAVVAARRQALIP